MKTLFISALLFCLSFTIKSQSTNNLNEDGKHVIYYKNGNVKAQGNYVNNRREGEWLFYYENGAMALKKKFSKGEQVGEWCYYNQDGVLLLKVDDISKINEKTEVALYENNKVKSKGTFVNGRKVSDFSDINKVEVKKNF